MGRRPLGKRAMTGAQRQRRYRQRLAQDARTGGKHYWLTPPDLMADLQERYGFDFDACPHPRPPGFDGLITNWGRSSYCNPPFVSSTPMKWARKCIEEHRKGKRVVAVFPIDGWLLRLIEAGAQITSLGNVRWVAIEDGS